VFGKYSAHGGARTLFEPFGTRRTHSTCEWSSSSARCLSWIIRRKWNARRWPRQLSRQRLIEQFVERQQLGSDQRCLSLSQFPSVLCSDNLLEFPDGLGCEFHTG
jgi:hypothetical protein